MVKVTCDPVVAQAREAGRGDRTIGLAAGQADVIHEGVTYDLEVDTSSQTPEEAAAFLAAALGHLEGGGGK